MRSLARVCVYAGSSAVVPPVYLEAAAALGAELARRRIGVVYGGGASGCMGALADGALAAGGEVVGVIPTQLYDLSLAHRGLTELQVVPDMHVRKATMARLSDAFVALPGGYGTLEELFEAITWAQLNLHHKPVGLLDTAGYYRGLVAFLDHATGEGFVHRLHRDMLVVRDDPAELAEALHLVRIPELHEWLGSRKGG